MAVYQLATVQEIEQSKDASILYAVEGVPLTFAEIYNVSKDTVGQYWCRFVARVREPEKQEPMGMVMTVRRSDGWTVVYGWERIF